MSNGTLLTNYQQRLHLDARSSSRPTHKVLLIGLSLLVFFSIYAVNFTFLPTYTQRLIALVLSTFFFLVITLRNPPWPRDRPFLTIVFFMLSILTYSIVLSGFTGFLDSSQVVSTVVLVGQVGVSTFGIAWLLHRRRFTIDGLVYLIVAVIALQAFFILLQYSVAPVRSWVAEYVPIGGNYTVDPVHRGRGLYHSPSASLAVVQSIGVFLCWYLLYTKTDAARNRYTRTVALLFAEGLLLTSLLLTGRTGFMVIPFVVIYAIVSAWRRGAIRKRHITLVIAVLLALLVVFLALSVLYSISGARQTVWGEDGLDRTVRWVMEEFIGGDSRSPFATVQVLMEDHLRFPTDPVTLLVGDARTWSYARVPSDMGYIRRLFAFGLIGSVLYYATLIAIFRYTIVRQVNSELRLVLTILAVYLFFVELKEPLLTHNLIASVYFIFFFFSFLSTNYGANRLVGGS